MIILALGSNLGNREANLETAIKAIEEKLLSGVVRSSVIETKPMLPADAPKEWEDKNFLNMVIYGEQKKNFMPEELLLAVKQIEAEVGRTPAPFWAPRVIDIDIIAVDNLLYSSATLNIPHTQALKRNFVMQPLLEILPNWKPPIS